MRRFAPLLVAVLAACGGHGSQAPSILEPGVQLSGVAVRSVGLLGGSLDVALMVTNPNPFSIRGTRVEFGLDLQGTHFGDVVFDNVFDLPQNVPTRVVVPLSFRWSAVGTAARGILDYGELNYGLQGRAFYTTPVGVIRLPFSRQGSVAVTRLAH